MITVPRSTQACECCTMDQIKTVMQERHFIFASTEQSHSDEERAFKSNHLKIKTGLAYKSQ